MKFFQIFFHNIENRKKFYIYKSIEIIKDIIKGQRIKNYLKNEYLYSIK